MKPSLFAPFKGKGHKGKGKGKSTKGSIICYNCGRPGHKSTECPESKAKRQREY